MVKVPQKPRDLKDLQEPKDLQKPKLPGGANFVMYSEAGFVLYLVVAACGSDRIIYFSMLVDCEICQRGPDMISLKIELF